ncbi:MAG: hypothetical protein ACOC7S_00845 [Planctomycetota bacterium]
MPVIVGEPASGPGAGPTSRGFWQLMAAVASFLGYSPELYGEEYERALAAVRSGYDNWLYPDVVGRGLHGWSFMRDHGTLSLEADASGERRAVYPLPTAFDSLVEPFTFESLERPPLDLVSEGRMRELRTAYDRSGDPTHVAIRPVDFDKAIGQRYEVVFWPTPSTSRTLHYTYTLQVDTPPVAVQSGSGELDSGVLTDEDADFGPLAVGDKVRLYDAEEAGIDGVYAIASQDSATEISLANPPEDADSISYETFRQHIHLRGGRRHFEAIKELCLAAAEQLYDDTYGLHSKLAERKLQTAVERDKRLASPDHIRRNGGTVRPADVATVYYNGVEM